VFLAAYLYSDAWDDPQKRASKNSDVFGGSFAIGLVGGYNVNRTKQDSVKEESKYTYACLGLQAQYKVTDFATVSVTFGYSWESDLTKSIDPDYEFETGYNFNGFMTVFSLLFPVIGDGGVLTPKCSGSGIRFAPYINTGIQKGTDLYFVDYEGTQSDYEVEPSFTKNITTVGGRLEYFFPTESGLQFSTHLNLNLFRFDNLKYEDDFNHWNTSGTTYFDLSSQFASFGINIWL
jgi:hypothetical protein